MYGGDVGPRRRRGPPRRGAADRRDRDAGQESDARLGPRARASGRGRGGGARGGMLWLAVVGACASAAWGRMPVAET